MMSLLRRFCISTCKNAYFVLFHSYKETNMGAVPLNYKK